MTSKDNTFQDYTLSYYPRIIARQKFKLTLVTQISISVFFKFYVCTFVCAQVYFNSMIDLKIFLEKFKKKMIYISEEFPQSSIKSDFFRVYVVICK